MNGLFGKLQMSAPSPVHPDVAATMGEDIPQPPIQQQASAPMSEGQQAASAWMAQQEEAAQQPKYKYSVGNPHIDKYLNMFLDAM